MSDTGVSPGSEEPGVHPIKTTAGFLMGTAPLGLFIVVGLFLSVRDFCFL